ncbi:hypothetical protein [Sphingomonas sp.]|uniref:hypothetical protein n=1 Tax=Sphingomonas sp. TaxID=28214 RepID=UPI0025E246AB|nr:hypothetical protein [Sphingomonas sp.]MBV9527894.1 hypothetical protein [Sphingomonas sp.]
MPTRRGEAWNDEDIATLRRMARAKATIEQIAVELERTISGIEAKVQKLKIKVTR